MGTLASELKSEREMRNISLAKIAADTRISLHYLQCLEDGRYGELPGGMYNRAFLRAYCESLRLDPHEVLRRYEAELSPAAEKPAKSKKKLPRHTAFPRRHAIVAWSIMFLISATGLFLSRKWIASVVSPYFSQASVSSIRYESRPHSSAPTSPLGTGIAASETLLHSGDSAALSSAQANRETVPVPAESVPPLRLDVEVTEKCWISIDSDGQRAVRKLLEPGEARTFGASEQFAIIIGNAGGIRLKINGKLAKPLGKSGDVVKVLINDKNLQEFIDQTSG